MNWKARQQAATRSRNIRNMSNPQLIASIRRLSREHVIYKLKNDGRDPPTAHLLRAALAEAERRHLTINHPEYVNEPDPPEGS